MNDIQDMSTTGRGDSQIAAWNEIMLGPSKYGPRGKRVIDEMANMGYDYEREFCSSSDDTI